MKAGQMDKEKELYLKKMLIEIGKYLGADGVQMLTSYDEFGIEEVTIKFEFGGLIDVEVIG